MLLVLGIGLVESVRPSHAAPLNPGDIVVVDPQGSYFSELLPPGQFPCEAGCGLLFKVDPSTGQRTILSDFNDPSKGPRGGDPSAVAIEAGGNVLVADRYAGRALPGCPGGCGALFRVDPSTGSRTLLSDFGDAGQGPTGGPQFGVAVEASGDILVVGEPAALFRVNPVTGSRTLLHSGVPFASPRAVAVEPSGKILVADASGLFRVDPVGSAVSRLSGGSPAAVAVEASGQILLVEARRLLRVNPSTGATALLADFAVGGTCPAPPDCGASPSGVTVEISGTILVVDPNAGSLPSDCGGFVSSAALFALNCGALFRVDATAGARTLLTDFGDPGRGPSGIDPSGVAIVPPLPPSGPRVRLCDRPGFLFVFPCRVCSPILRIFPVCPVVISVLPIAVALLVAVVLVVGRWRRGVAQR